MQNVYHINTKRVSLAEMRSIISSSSGRATTIIVQIVLKHSISTTTTTTTTTSCVGVLSDEPLTIYPGM